MDSTSSPYSSSVGAPPKFAEHTPSLLLTLPPELRETIWKLVLGIEGQTIHLYHHEVSQEGDDSRPTMPSDDKTQKPLVLKPSCCRKTHDWDEAYNLSQRPGEFATDARDRRGSLKHNSTGVLSAYNARHRHCRQPDVRCQDLGECTLQCRCSRQALQVDCISAKEDGLDFSLLRVCRSIYFEAAHLPYKHNTFSFPSEANLAFFATKVLRPWQRDIIQRIEVVAEPPVAQLPISEIVTETTEEGIPLFAAVGSTLDMKTFTFDDSIEASLKLFPRLQDLKLSLPYINDPRIAELALPEDDESALLDLPFIRKVRVIVGADTDVSMEYDNGSREERRELAAAIEQFLQGDHSNTVDDRSLAWWRYLLSNGRAVPYESHRRPSLKPVEVV